MKRFAYLSCLSAACLLAATAPAAAHLPPGQYGSFAAGFSHPLFGLDHILAMVAVGLAREKVSSHLISGVTIACENSSSSVTLSGDVGPLEKVMSALRESYPDALVRKLRVPLAYHSCKLPSSQIPISNLLTESRPYEDSGRCL